MLGNLTLRVLVFLTILYGSKIRPSSSINYETAKKEFEHLFFCQAAKQTGKYGKYHTKAQINYFYIYCCVLLYQSGIIQYLFTAYYGIGTLYIR